MMVESPTFADHNPAMKTLVLLLFLPALIHGQEVELHLPQPHRLTKAEKVGIAGLSLIGAGVLSGLTYIGVESHVDRKAADAIAITAMSTVSAGGIMVITSDVIRKRKARRADAHK
jgi:hypothetical protein